MKTEIPLLRVRMTDFPFGDAEELGNYNVVPANKLEGDDCSNMREQHSYVSFQYRSWRMDRIVNLSKQQLIRSEYFILGDIESKRTIVYSGCYIFIAASNSSSVSELVGRYQRLLLVAFTMISAPPIL